MTASLTTMFSRRPKDNGASGKVIGNPILTQTSADLNKMGTHRYVAAAEPQPPALPPKDGVRRKQPATYSAGVARKPYAPLQIDFNAIKRGDRIQPKSNDPPSPVSPLSVISGRRKHGQGNDPTISPPGSAGDPYGGKEYIAGQRNHRTVSGPAYGQPAAPRERINESFSTRARQYADRAGTGLDNWIRAQRDNARDNTPPPPPPPASTKPPSPRVPPAPAPKLKIRQSTFQPLRNSLQDAATQLQLTEPLPALPVEAPIEAPKYILPKKKKSAPLPLTAIPTQHAPQLPPKDDTLLPEPLSADKLYEDLFKTLGKSTTAPISRIKRRNGAGPRDHLEELEDEQEDLNEKRVELRSKIWQLQNAIPQYTTTYNAASRKLMLERLEEIKTELASVDRQLHEVGLKVHRLIRRRAKNEGTERPTHLWVSRVCD